MNKQELIKKNIFAQIDKFYAARPKVKFVPGKTPVPCGGRVYDGRELANLADAALEFWLTSGRYAGIFEKRLAHLLGTKFCLLVNSGSSANLLALTALTSPLLKEKRLKPGDEVITTASGFATTLNPILQNNLVPVFVDIHPGTYNISTDNLEKAVGKKTRALFTAHTLGNPVEVDLIGRFCKKYGLWWIEDNCDGLGSKYKGRHTGSFGDISTCSFYPSHHITMGEGGAVLTDNPLLKKIAVSLRDWGRDCWCAPGSDNTCKKRFSWKFYGLPEGYDHKYVYSHIGYNFKVTEMQAAIGCAQLDKLPAFIQARSRNFARICGIFKKHEDYFALPQTCEGALPSWFGFPVRIRKEAPFKRQELIDHLEKNKIATRMLFAGNLLRQPAYRGIKYRQPGTLENTDLVMRDLFWIGVYPGITGPMLDHLGKIVDGFFNKYQSKKG